MENDFTWKEQYSVGIELIDEQHKKLISLFQILGNAIENQNSDEKLEELFVDLAKYANYHFETEEKYFELHNYPDSEDHIEGHRDFTQGILLLYQEFRNNRTDLPFQLFNFLQNWLEHHVLGSDQEYGKYLKSIGVKGLIQ